MASSQAKSPGPGWKKNPGYAEGQQPRGTRGKRVRVILGHGKEAVGNGVATAAPGWAADKANWSLRNWDFDIVWYFVL